MRTSALSKKPASIILLALLVATMSCSSTGRRTAIHELPDWQPVGVLGPGHLKHIAYAPKGHKVAICTTRNIEIWDAVTWQTDRELLGGVRTAAWSPDGSRLVSGAHAHTVKIWDALTGRELRTLTGHPILKVLSTFRLYELQGKITARLARAYGS